MKPLYKYISVILFICFLSISSALYSHSVQVAYGINCLGQLRIYVEHWHAAQNPNSTTMNISVNVGGVVNNIVGTPNGSILGTTIANLPGSSIPIVSFVQGGRANMENDWIWYDFPGVASGVPVVVTIISGNNAFTSASDNGGGDGAVLYPASSQPFIIPTNVFPTFSNQTVCGGTAFNPVPFTNQNDQWTNSNPSIGLPAAGAGDIGGFVPNTSTSVQVSTITVSSACYTTSFSYVVEPSPDPTFSFPASVGNKHCKHYAVPFTMNNTNNVSSAQWTFGDGNTSALLNPQHSYATNGDYSVGLTVSSSVNTCTASSTQTLSVYTPTADFNLANNCLNLTTTYTSTSVFPVAVSANVWNYGDASVGSGENPTHVYAISNTFPVKLLVIDANVCKDSITKSVTIYPNPVISFSAVPVCHNVTTVFTNSSSIAAPDNIPAANWAWDFEDDGVVDNTTQNTTFTYANTGIHKAELKATSNNNCSDSLLVDILVNVNPVATFSPVPACENLNIILNNTSSVSAPDYISGWNWDFGANSSPATSNLPNPNLSYNASGSRLITLTVTANTSCTATVTQSVEIFPDPVPDFTFANKCINAQPFNFDATTTSIASGTINYAWSYGDGTSGAGVTTNDHIYTTAQGYNVRLTTTSDKGCQKFIIKQAEVYQRPIMAISNSRACDTKVMTFTAVAQPNSGNVVSWLWDYNTSITSMEGNGTSVSYIFPAPGNQTVALVTETNYGCKDTIYKPVYVDYVPKPLFSVDKSSGCPLPHEVVFTDNTLPITGPAVNSTWKWVFGDGKTITVNNNGTRTYSYTNVSSSQNALYDVKLVVTTDQGCVDSLEKTSFITVYPKPIAQYNTSPNPGNVVTPLVYFTNNSQGYNKWWWRFGDSNQIDSLNVDPTHYYDSETADTYNSVLIVANQYGCLDTAYVSIEMKPEFAFYIPNAFTPVNEDGVNDTFTGKGIGIEKYEMWVYDRWGNSLFYSNDITKGWDGKVQGKSDVVQQDVYVWKVKLKDVLGKRHDYVGHVTLLK